MPRPKGSKNKKYKNKILGLPIDTKLISKYDMTRWTEILIEQGYIMKKEDFIPWVTSIIQEIITPIINNIHNSIHDLDVRIVRVENAMELLGDRVTLLEQQLSNLPSIITETVFPVGITIMTDKEISYDKRWYNGKPIVTWLNMQWEFIMAEDANSKPIPLCPCPRVAHTYPTWLPYYQPYEIFNTNGHTHSISGQTEDTVLDISQMPSHDHTITWDGNSCGSGAEFWYLARQYGNNPTFHTSATGGNEGHHHSIMPTNTTISTVSDPPECMCYYFYKNLGHI